MIDMRAVGLAFVLCVTALPASADGQLGVPRSDQSVVRAPIGAREVAVLGPPRVLLPESTVERPPDIAPEWQFRAHPLHDAALNDDAAAVRRLVDAGFDVELRDRYGKTPLMVAAAFGNVAAATALLDLGAATSTRDEQMGATALHYAARAGHVAMATAHLLLARGADADARTIDGATALHLAAFYNHTAMVSLLVEGGAGIDATDATGLTPLQYARRQGRTNAVDELLGLGARVDGLYDAVNAGDLIRVRALIAEGAPVDRLELSGTALHLATAKGYVAIAAALIDAGANLEAEGDPVGSHPLHIAAIAGQPVVAALLLDRGADIDSRNQEGRTPLMVAAAFKRDSVALTLVAAHADLNAVDAVEKAVIHHAAISGDADLILMLLARGVDVNQQNSFSGMAPLHYAAGFGDLPTIQVLASHGADLDLRDISGSTPYDHALRCRAMFAVDLLQKLAAN
jgi:ankyrin repeat protein